MENELKNKILNYKNRAQKLKKQIGEEIYYLVQLKKQIGINRIIKAKIQTKIRVLNSSLRLLTQNQITEKDFEENKRD